MFKRRLHLVLPIAALAVIAIAVVFAWPRSSSAENRAREQARNIACNVSQVGLGARPCAAVEGFRAEPGAWRFRIALPGGRYRCYALSAAGRPLYPLQRVRCH